MNVLLPFLILGLVHSFLPLTQQVIKRNHHHSHSVNPLITRLSAQPNSEDAPQTVKIDRDWTYTEESGDIYKGTGSMTVKVFQPKNNDKGGKVEGVVFFLHGFSQFTVAYSNTLQKVSDYANVAVLSVDTGITSPIILSELLSKPLKLMKDRSRAQFVLQRALSEDTKQCIRMVYDGKLDMFLSEGNTTIGTIPIGVCGHSMGAGLSFEVAAAFQDINFVIAMGPFAGVPQFDPIQKGVDKRTVNNSMLLAGTWDFIATPKHVETIAKESNRNKKNSSIFVNIYRGLHTGFEDELVITNIPLPLNVILSLVFDISSALDKIILLILIKLSRSVTIGQLEGSELLIKFFFKKMARGEQIKLEEAKNYLAENLEDKGNMRFHMTYSMFT